MSTPRKINAILLNIKVCLNWRKLVNMCGSKQAIYWQHFMQIYLAWQKILQKVSRGRRLGSATFLTHTVGNVTPSRTLWPNFAFFFVRASRGQYVCQIWSFYLWPFPIYRGGPKISKVGHMIPSWPLSHNFAFFSLVFPVVNLHAKFEFSGFNRFWDMEGAKNLKSKSREPLRRTPFDLNLHFVVRASRAQYVCRIRSV